MTTDLIIIGSGPGGYRAAEYAAKNGLQVVIFEGAHAGGTCLNCGCIPTKTLLHEASLPHPDYNRASTHKETVVSQLRAGVEQLMARPHITLIQGWAAFKDSHTITCNGTDYEAPNIIIATGSSPKQPPISGIDHPRVLNSTQLLSVPAPPATLLIIGAGVIGMEFASIFHRFGTRVTIVEYLKECLPATDSDLAKRLRKNMEKQGITFHMQAAVKSIDETGIVFEQKGKEQHLDVDAILIATGRQPNTAGLNLEAADILYDRQGIHTDPETMLVRHTEGHSTRNTGVGIYAIGDVNGQSLLAHAATMQGIRAVNHILGRPDNIHLDIMPAAVFTTPEIAGVGLTEDQCRQQGIACTSKKGFYRANGKALASDSTEGLLKLIVADDGRQILGAHCMGAHAADIIQEVTALMNLHATIDQLKDIVHIHPTLGEILHDTAQQF